MRTRNFRTRAGAASFYVVVFTTMLFTIITMSFVRLMIYETTRTINNDLSNSAYDSALAGVEDAKVALLKYQSCVNEGKTVTSGGECGDVIEAIQDGMQGDKCETVAKALGRNSDDSAEVIIEERVDTGRSANSEAMEQAYTCVKVYTTVDDYKATLDGSTRVKVIPLRGEGANAEDRVKWLDLEWSWDATYQAQARELGRFEAENSRQAPPIVFDVYQTDEEYSLGELSVRGANGTDHFSLVLQPTDLSGEEVTTVSANDILNKYDSKTAANSPIGVKCGASNCHVKVELPKTFRGDENRNASTFLARAEVLYNNPSVDFRVQMIDKDSHTIPFVDVQAAVDSTGRANDLYRRVEARVELNDTNYPYPEFAVQLLDSSSVTKKNFYITENCWNVQNGTVTEHCDDYGEVK